MHTTVNISVVCTHFVLPCTTLFFRATSEVQFRERQRILDAYEQEFYVTGMSHQEIIDHSLNSCFCLYVWAVSCPYRHKQA